MIFKFDVAVVGEIPSTLLPEVRLNLFEVNWAQIGNFMMPAFSIAHSRLSPAFAGTVCFLPRISTVRLNTLPATSAG